METVCENCRDKKAVTTCDVCGSQVCADCKLEYGCSICHGGERRME